MNIALEQTKEIVDGKMRRNYGDAFVRGNNGMLDLEHGTVNDANDLSQSCTSQPTHRKSHHATPPAIVEKVFKISVHTESIGALNAGSERVPSLQPRT